MEVEEGEGRRMKEEEGGDRSAWNLTFFWFIKW